MQIPKRREPPAPGIACSSARVGSLTPLAVRLLFRPYSWAIKGESAATRPVSAVFRPTPYEISDPAAVAFARGFYAAIARGRAVDDAVSSGRVAILGLSDGTLEWVTPMLYLRGHAAHLFTFPALAETESAKAPVASAAASLAARAGTARRPGRRTAPQPPTTPLPVPPSHLARTFTGHTGQVCGVAFSPDGHLLATASHDGTAAVEPGHRQASAHPHRPHWRGLGCDVQPRKRPEYPSSCLKRNL